jgi:O-antigen/teichoic acid export membrane protein
MLSFFQGSVAVGLYEAATNIFYRLNVFGRTFNMALLPLMARKSESETDRLKPYIEAAAKVQIIFGIPLTVLCVMLSERLMVLIYGQSFQLSAVVFSTMATIIVLRFIDHTLATLLTSIGLQVKRSIAVAAAAAFNITINLWMIPRYSYIGAALATVITEIGFFSILYIFVSRRIERPLAFSVLVKPCVAGVLMAATVWWLGGLPLVWVLTLSIIAYLVGLILLGTFSNDEILLFLRISQLYRLIPDRYQSKIIQSVK